jgi:hypothetical protein
MRHRSGQYSRMARLGTVSDDGESEGLQSSSGFENQ